MAPEARGVDPDARDTAGGRTRVEAGADVAPDVLPLVHVVIVGPQASGKSALAAALSDDLRRRGEQVAVVELDLIASMALPTLPDWEVAHRITEEVTGLWLRAGMSCVVVEGVGTSEAVRRLLQRAPDGVPSLTVVTTAPFDVAFARALADPTRGLSRQEDHLRAVYERWVDERPRIGADLTLHTDETGLAQCVETVRSRIVLARRRQDR